MSAIIESTLLAHKWKINRSALGEDVYGKFRCLQISAFVFEGIFKAQHINVNAIDYVYERKLTFLEVVIDDSAVDEFYEKSAYLWRAIYEDLPLHRNDRWDSKRRRPIVSDAYRDHATGDLILMIKFNVNSVRYIFPNADDMKLNDCLDSRYI